MEDAEQLELFELPAAARNPDGQEETSDAAVSADGKTAFRFSNRRKKSIGGRKLPFDSGYVVELPAYMKSPKFRAVRELVSEWIAVSCRRKTAKARALGKSLSERIWSATNQILSDMGLFPVRRHVKIPPIVTKGKFHDLEQVFAAVNATYFNGELKARITWSNRVGGLSFQTKRTDPITGEKVDLISISRGYDFANCPFYAVAGVVYHECLHIAVPPVVVNGRRVVHGKAFRQRERRYLYFEKWQEWHRKVLPQNICSMRRERSAKRSRKKEPE